MPFTQPHARNPQALLGANQASTLSCQLTVYNPGGGLPYSSVDTLTVSGGQVVASGGNPDGAALLSSLYSGNNIATACPATFTTSQAFGTISSGAQGTGEVVAIDQNSSGIYEIEPVIVIGGAILIILALSMKGIEWVRRVINGVTDDEGLCEEWLEGWLHPNGRVATVVNHKTYQDGDHHREKVLGVWSLDQCERAGVDIQGSMDDMIVNESY